MSKRSGLRERIARFLFGPVIDALVERAVNASISVRIDDSAGWDVASKAGPTDRPWAERYEDLEDALEAWRKNFLARRIVTLTRSYVVGNGIEVSSEDPGVNEFVQTFWHHRQNQMDRRLGPMCDELVRSGELFPVLFTNRVDGMSYLRFVPASRIREIKCDPEDYETELEYGELRDVGGLRWWRGPGHPRSFKSYYRKFEPLMLHFAVNRPIGAVRGEGDLGPILAWIKRYTGWLNDRVRLNRQRTRQGVLDIEIADDAMVQEKRDQLRRTNPIEAGVYVHGPGEKATLHSLQIQADDAKEDGRALRLAVATGANVGLHFLGEGETINYATAREMGEPTTLFYGERQGEFGWFLCDLLYAAYCRYAALKGLVVPESVEDLGLVVATTEVARADNLALAQAARQVVEAFGLMADRGWIDDETAVRLAFKFAGEVIGEEEIGRILGARGGVQGENEEPGGEGEEPGT